MFKRQAIRRLEREMKRVREALRVRTVVKQRADGTYVVLRGNTRQLIEVK